MKKTLPICLFALLLFTLPTLAQELSTAQQAAVTPVSKPPSAIDAYNKWRDDSLLKFALGLNTSHYCLTVVSQRLDANTARVELAIAADMNKYTLGIKPVKITQLPNGDIQQVDAGTTTVIDRQPGKDGNPKKQVVQEAYIIKASKTANAIEITWTPAKGNSKVSNTCIVLLRDTPTVLSNGFIEGLPIR